MFSLQSQYTILWSRRNLLTWLPAAALAMAASLVLAACQSDDDTLAPTSEPTVEPGDAVASANALALTTQRILFLSSKQTGDPVVTTMDPQGNSRVPLVSSLGMGSKAAWSWDNKRIALVRNRVTGNTTQPDIYLINADGTNGHWAAATPSPWQVYDPSWSPDGSRLVVRVIVQYVAYLGWMDVATGQITFFNLLQGGTKGSRPVYNATGTKIIYLGESWKTIEQINADGSNHKVRFSSTTQVYDPSFSPDGKKIVFSRIVGTKGNMEIFVKNLTDGTITRLTTTAAQDDAPSWSPDGTRIAFSSNRSGTGQIWTMNATTGGSLAQITHTSNWEAQPAWTH